MTEAALKGATISDLAMKAGHVLAGLSQLPLSP